MPWLRCASPTGRVAESRHAQGVRFGLSLGKHVVTSGIATGEKGIACISLFLTGLSLAGRVRSDAISLQTVVTPKRAPSYGQCRVALAQHDMILKPFRTCPQSPSIDMVAWNTRYPYWSGRRQRFTEPGLVRQPFS